MSRYDLTSDDVSVLLAGEPSFRTRQVWDGLYRRGVGPAELTTLPQLLRDRLGAEPSLAPALRLDAEVVADNGATVKWRWGLHDGRMIETVLMNYADRTTVCVSSQAGCAMACGFCATGQAGFQRNLSTGEIVEQVIRAAAEARTQGWRVSNVVFMGMGEPMANFERMWEAVERFHADVGLSARHITISTIGIVPGILRLAAASLPVNLAVSLHAADDELRNDLIPINRRYPLAALMDACQRWVQAKNRRLSFEWALIAGVNDRPADAARLAALAREVRAHVNLIPLNPTPGYLTQGTSAAGVRGFREILTTLGVNATVRHNRGTSIDAACGQLAARASGQRPEPN